MIFYTVVLDKPGYPVKYISPDMARVATWRGSFSDPGEASQEFAAWTHDLNPCYLDEPAFKAKAAALAKLRRRKRKEAAHAD